MTTMTLVAAGCTGATGEPRSAGAAPVASAPARLWPDRAPAPQPPPDKTGQDGPSPLPGLPRVPSGNIRRLDPLDVVRAQIADDARHDAPAFDKATERRIQQCGDKPQHCPVRAPEYQDLTHDGKDELIVGIEGAEHTLAVWAYMLRGGVVNRILDTAGTPLSVEVSDGDVIMREPTGSPGYEMRTVHAWDERRQTMEIRTMEFDQKVSSLAPERAPAPERTPVPERIPSPRLTPSPPPTPSPPRTLAPPRTPSPGHTP
ncbi:hypothetical protein ACGF4C_07985 [Streptomyces sp. NPDC048197]|uniref:hypothetical protein n=1 Tax=Streptomyces sp. NPDC048197 TaxID=3365511 RepID=UPI003714908F